MAQQVRIFAYLSNVLLMASFLGMGLGVAVGRRRPNLIHLALPSLAMTAAAALGTAPPLWLAIACLPLLFLSPRVLSAVSAIVVVALGYRSIQGALFSPYNRLDFGRADLDRALTLIANRDAHQILY